MKGLAYLKKVSEKMDISDRIEYFSYYLNQKVYRKRRLTDELRDLDMEISVLSSWIRELKAELGEEEEEKGDIGRNE